MAFFIAAGAAVKRSEMSKYNNTTFRQNISNLAAAKELQVWYGRHGMADN